MHKMKILKISDMYRKYRDIFHPCAIRSYSLTHSLVILVMMMMMMMMR